MPKDQVRHFLEKPGRKSERDPSKHFQSMMDVCYGLTENFLGPLARPALMPQTDMRMPPKSLVPPPR
jgi:hypothetical protein